ncbi:MAG: hypothetical protein ACLUIQ_11990 [Dialister invisus]
MTGSIHGYGKAKDYYESGRAELVLWPNHMTEKEMELAGKIISEKLFLITAQTGNRSLMYFLYKNGISFGTVLSTENYLHNVIIRIMISVDREKCKP